MFSCICLSFSLPHAVCSVTFVLTYQRLHEMADGELKDMEFFFTTLPTPFTAFDSEAYKTSVVGEFSTHPYLKCLFRHRYFLSVFLN